MKNCGGRRVQPTSVNFPTRATCNSRRHSKRSIFPLFYVLRVRIKVDYSLLVLVRSIDVGERVDDNGANPYLNKW